MTDNPTLSPRRQPEDQDAALRPSRWVALIALLVAPLAATVVEGTLFDIGARIGGYRTEAISLLELPGDYFLFALVFFPLGGPLMFMFWRRAPFRLLPSTVAGAMLGALVGYICILVLQLPDEGYAGVFATVGLGVAGGVAGGLTTWLICRVGSRKSND